MTRNRLNRIGVSYYLTGSMASNYWGIPRTTHDLDFVSRRLGQWLLAAMGAGIEPDQRAGRPVIHSDIIYCG